MKNFLESNRYLIREGIDYIDKHFYKDDFLSAIGNIGWKCVIVPDSEWCKGKLYPTETSREYKEIRILNSYARSNPGTCGFWDEQGWTFHELVHAIIFSNLLPKKYLDLNSPFGYPLNTDEIYCFGYQIREMSYDGTYPNLLNALKNQYNYSQDDINSFELLKEIVV